MQTGPFRRVGVTLLTAAIGASFTVATASAAPALERPPFYEPPAELPAENGDIVRSEPSEYFLDPLKTVPVDANVQRMMYKSSGRGGEPIAVTGTVITPNGEWTGDGERPVVGFSAGTQGMADRCAPSRQLANGTEYEGFFIKAMLSKGYAVALTDYEGLGTPGVHTYVNREVTGNAVLDSVRAAQNLPESTLPDNGPVVLYGYSQGGGGVSSAAELAPAYAPELDLRGVAGGAVPAELGGVAENLDGGLYAAFLGYALSGLASGYDLDLEPVLNEEGEQYRQEIEDSCLLDAVPNFAFTRSADLTEDGRPLTDSLDEAPFKDAVAEQRIGNGKPEVPVLLTQSLLDDVIPFEQTKTLAADWCAQGADVQFAPNLAPTHVGGAVANFPRAFQWIDDRLAGEETSPNCGNIDQAPADPAVPYDEQAPLLPQLTDRILKP
ncbi:lipase [Allosaccharopolyspora coralli]|uniref:Lipase n=1 Tax=Allosaccharopolyspora coralli TaxID=2665642 RepID=A0A5Q3QCD0_9PSEU|nr:lipase family protein [Allosaccharopolyspora coralli]QGK71016.1 lipase [Allosaccharopolyspora coralli]